MEKQAPYQNKEVKQVILRTLPLDLHTRAKIQAAREQDTLQGIIIKALEMYLKRKGG